MHATQYGKNQTHLSISVITLSVYVLYVKGAIVDDFNGSLINALFNFNVDFCFDRLMNIRIFSS
jgi:hypothetical protein